MSMDPDEQRRFGAGPPIPPQDRLWRHPSELGLQGDAGPRVVLHRRPSRSRVLIAAAVGLVGGSVLGIGALAASGSLGGGGTTTVVEQIAAAPAVKNQTPASGELAVAEAALPAVAQVSVTGPTGTSTATGVTVRDDGLVLTTSDILDAASEVTVTLADGSVYPATVVGRDRSSDLGVIDIEATGLPVAALPEASLGDAVDFGDEIVVVSSASGDTTGPLVASGVVTAPSTAVGDEEMPMYGMVGVHLAPGTGRPTGGALVLDGNGALIGVASDRVEEATDEQSVVVYATPFDHARRVFRQVVETGSFTPPVLPVDVGDLAEAEATTTDGVDAGVVVIGPPANPLAASADLRAGDVITAINGEAINDDNDHRTAVRRYVPGDEVEVTIIRDGEVTNRPVTLGDDPRLR